MTIFRGIVALAVVVTVAVGVVGCESVSCPEGEESYITHYIPIVHNNGKTSWVQQVPQYDCRPSS